MASTTHCANIHKDKCSSHCVYMLFDVVFHYCILFCVYAFGCGVCLNSIHL
jgi:hypothetical protein